MAAVYDLKGLNSFEEIRRLLEVAALDALALPNSLGRSRTLTHIASIAMTLLEKGPLADRVAAVEAFVEESGPRLLELNG